MPLDSIATFVADFALGIEAADRRRPVAINQRSKQPFQPGLGERHEASFAGLVHPVHARGRVFAWEISPSEKAAQFPRRRRG